MNDEEILQIVSKIDKKVDKILNLTTKIAKTLHLIPVTEKEEREIQLLQRKNLGIAAKVTNELDAMENKETEEDMSLHSYVSNILTNASDAEVLGDIIGDDYLGDSNA